MATILTKKSDTSSAVPGSGDLTNSTGGAELAVNTADKRIFTKNSAGTVVELGTNPSSITTGTLSATGNVTLGDASGDSVTINAATVSTPNGLNFDSNTFVIDAANNYIGIGTSSPAARLEISGGNAGVTDPLLSPNRLRFTDSDATKANNQVTGGIEWYTADTDSAGVYAYISSATNSAGDGYVTFATGSSSTLAERMRIDSAGNVGIGTTAPRSKISFGTSSVDTNGYDITGLRLYDNGSTNFYGFGVSSTQLNYRAGLTSDQHVWYAGTSERMRIDSSGNVGVGTSSPLNFGGANLQVQNSTIGSVVWSNGTYIGQLLASASAEVTIGSRSNHPLRFGTNDTERMRIDSSGNLLVGTTTSYGLVTSAKSSGYCFATNSVSNGADHILFTNGGTTTGSIVRVGSTQVAYNTSSDYRLKENIAPMTGALATVAQLKPCTYTWKVDGSTGQGFIAHELQAIIPDAVSGEKDAVDDDGNPKYQGVDTSFLVATLTAAIQELKSENDALKSRLDAAGL